MLNLWRMSLLRDLANLDTMSAVAKAAKLSRPAVSQHLSQLERETGLTLLERTAHGVQLTDEGRHLAEHARKLIAHVESIEADMATLQESVIGTVRFSAFGSFGSSVVPHAMRRLREVASGLEPIFVEREPRVAIDSLLKRNLDIAVVDDMVSASTVNYSIEFIELMEDRYLAAIPEDSPLCELQELHISDLQYERWVLNESASAYQDLVLHACQDAGFTPNVVCSTRSGAAALSFVANSSFVTILPGLSTLEAPEGVVFRSFAPKLRRRIFAAVNRGNRRRPAVDAVLEALLEETRIRSMRLGS